MFAQEFLENPDGTLAFYFRYLRGVRRIPEIRAMEDQSPESLNVLLEVDDAVKSCVIAGTKDYVIDQLIALVDRLGPFGTLVSAGHDWDDTSLWQDSMARLANDVMPIVSQHAGTVRK